MLTKVLSIATTKASYGIRRVQDSKLEIDSGSPIKSDITATKPMLNMKITKPEIEIDQRECFAEAGLKTPDKFLKDCNAETEKIYRNAIDNIVSQGNELADIHIGENPIPRHAEYNEFDQFTKESNMVTMPRSRPKITLKRGDINFNLDRGKIINNTVVQQPRISYQMSKIECYMKEYGKVEISVIDRRI